MSDPSSTGLPISLLNPQNKEILPQTASEPEPEGAEAKLLPANSFIKGLEAVLTANFSAISMNMEENKTNFDRVKQHIDKHEELINNVGEKIIFLERVVERVKIDEIEHLIVQMESKLTNKFNDSIDSLSTSYNSSFLSRFDDLSFNISLISNRLDQSSSRLSLLTRKINEILQYLIEKDNEEENEGLSDNYIPVMPPSLLPISPEDASKKIEESEGLIESPKKLNFHGRRRKRLTEERLEEILLAKLEMLKGEVRKEINQKLEVVEEDVTKKLVEVGKKIADEEEKQREINKEVEGWRRNSLVINQNTREKVEVLEEGWNIIREGLEDGLRKTEGKVKEIEESCYRKEEADKKIERIKKEIDGIAEKIREMMDGYGRGNGGENGLFTKIKWNCASCDKQVDSLKGNLSDYKSWAVFPPKETLPARIIGKLGNSRRKITDLMEKVNLPVLSFDGGMRTMTDSFKEKNSKLKPMKF